MCFQAIRSGILLSDLDNQKQTVDTVQENAKDWLAMAEILGCLKCTEIMLNAPIHKCLYFNCLMTSALNYVRLLRFLSLMYRSWSSARFNQKGKLA